MTRREPSGSLERNPRRARWLHAATYLLTFALMATGWWLLLGREGKSSPLASIVRAADVDVHKTAGWALVGLAAVTLAWGWRGALTMLIESITFRRSEASWFARWPGAVWSGRFGYHEGHFDPGQRIANLVMVGGLIVLSATGLGLIAVKGGAVFVWLDRVHRWATYVVTPVILGHVVVAAGLLPGYRGSWRAMHLGGRVSPETAERLWPRWYRSATGRSPAPTRADRG